MDWDHREKPSGREVSGTNPGELKLHSLIDLDHCHRCLDKGVYLGNELVGAITRQGKRWHVWRIVDAGEPMDCAELAMYEEQMNHMGDFGNLHDAREYVRGSFCNMVLGELELRKTGEKK